MNCFHTDKRIKLGIWGLGRGEYLIRTGIASDLNIDVVAGCDYNETFRENFKKECPNAFVTTDEDEFLKQDMDAVLIATWFPNHARDAIKALNAGKHVMCEVTSFFTLAEGVELIEAVEKSGKVYHLLENYPFRKENLYAKRLWDTGMFGDLMYAEFDYVHNCNVLCYTFADCSPMVPGWEAHYWRGWLNTQYYNTHSLGPVMQITGRRPVSVTALNSNTTNGFLSMSDETVLKEGRGAACPSLVRMDNGAVVRNLMGATTADAHSKRLWGTKAFLDVLPDKNGDVIARLGSIGGPVTVKLHPEWPDMGELADTMGHGGGDFWELYYFAREILTGEKGPWDIYSAADVTATGIMAVRSVNRGGEPQEIPNFRLKEVRDKYRYDNEIPPHVDSKHIFPDGHDTSITGDFSTLMTKVIDSAWRIRVVRDGIKLFPEMVDNADRFEIIKFASELLPEIEERAENLTKLEKIGNAYPDCPAGRAIKGILRNCDPDWLYDSAKAKQELGDWLKKPISNEQ